MDIIPVCSDSMGVRSMAVLVKAKGVSVFIDPSAALGPSRYGLPPAREEVKALHDFKEKIRKLAKDVDVIVISHYHYDHHDPDEDFYKDKVVLAKDRLKNINRSQRTRGKYFEDMVAPVARLEYADGKEFDFGGVKIKFSKPYPHGPPGTRLGYVIMVCIDDGGMRILHTSDVQGPVDEKCADDIIEMNPDLIIVDGPPTYFLGWKFSVKSLERAINNLLRIIREIDCEIIMDHHLLRDLRYKEHMAKVYAKGKIKTFAEYLGLENNMLEARRKELWGYK